MGLGSQVLAMEVSEWEGRPRIDQDLRALIRQMSLENRLWGAPRTAARLRELLERNPN
jgi:hypothetical protein